MPIMSADSILRTLAEPVLVLDNSLRAVLANPAFYDTLQVAHGELEGKSIKELILGYDGQPSLRAVLEAVVNFDSSVDRIEVECEVTPNTKKILSVSARKIVDTEGAEEMVLVELRDITFEQTANRRLKELNDAIQVRGGELERTNQDLESFNRWVSHDLRTPLRFVSTIAHRLLEDHGAELSISGTQMVEMILDCTREMGQLIENLLAFAQVDRVALKKRNTNLTLLAQRAAADLQPECAGRDVAITIDELPPSLCDRALIKQVYLNLVANALVFTRSCAHAEIHIGCLQGDQGLVYFVRDNGEGFDMSQSDAIFLPFHRLRQSQKSQGTGVGLTLVKRIIERHGGRIWVESARSSGATFYFELGQ